MQTTIANIIHRPKGSPHTHSRLSSEVERERPCDALTQLLASLSPTHIVWPAYHAGTLSPTSPRKPHKDWMSQEHTKVLHASAHLAHV